MPLPDGSSPMPDPSQGGGAPAPDGSSDQPIGSSPATQPVANRGMQAAGLAQLQVAVKILERALPMLGAGSEAGAGVLKALNLLAKQVAPGEISSGVEQSALSELQNKLRQAGPMIAAMRGGAPAGSAPPGMPAPGGAPGGPPPALAAMMQPQGSA